MCGPVGIRVLLFPSFAAHGYPAIEDQDEQRAHDTSRIRAEILVRGPACTWTGCCREDLQVPRTSMRIVESSSHMTRGSDTRSDPDSWRPCMRGAGCGMNGIELNLHTEVGAGVPAPNRMRLVSGQ